MIRIHLPPTEAERLEALFRSTADRRLRDRLQIVLMAHRGRARQDVAADLSIHRKTVTRWLNAFCTDGLDGWQAALPVLTGAAPYQPQPARLPPPSILPANERRRAGTCVRLALAVAQQQLVDSQVRVPTPSQSVPGAINPSTSRAAATRSIPASSSVESRHRRSACRKPGAGCRRRRSKAA